MVNFRLKAVGEADWCAKPPMSEIVSLGPDRQKILTYQAFYIWRVLPGMNSQKVTAYFIGDGNIHLISVFGIFFLDSNMCGDDRAEVVEDEARPDFHFKEVLFLRMKAAGPEDVLEFAKGSFYIPTQVINLLDFFHRKLVCRKIGDDVFIAFLSNFKTQDAKRNRVFHAGSGFNEIE